MNIAEISIKRYKNSLLYLLLNKLYFIKDILFDS